ncbi:hypothetical protein QT621_24235 [Xanthomonas citri pv. citri]
MGTAAVVLARLAFGVALVLLALLLLALEAVVEADCDVVDGGVEAGLQAVNAPDILTKAINKALMADDCALTLVRTL